MKRHDETPSPGKAPVKTLEQFADLAVRARQEQAPVPEVSAAVLRRIREEKAPAFRTSVLAVPANAWPLWGMAAGLLAVGVLMALNSFVLWSDWNGSVYAWVADFSSWRSL